MIKLINIDRSVERRTLTLNGTSFGDYIDVHLDDDGSGRPLTIQFTPQIAKEVYQQLQSHFEQGTEKTVC